MCDNYGLINTVSQNKSRYNSCNYLRAVYAQKMQNIILGTSYSHIKDVVSTNQLQNCPHTRENIKAADDIFGSLLMILQEKTTKKKTSHVSDEFIPLPPTVVEKYIKFTLSGNDMTINGLHIFIIKSKYLKLTGV